jgi:hypothetical protein
MKSANVAATLLFLICIVSILIGVVDRSPACLRARLQSSNSSAPAMEIAELVPARLD